MCKESANDNNGVLKPTVNNEPKKIFIGVAWPYANGPLHMGHFAGSLIPPDIFARYHRMNGSDVLMVSGSDQHGTPITLQAMATKRTPLEVAEEFHKINSECIEKMGISFNLFSKTSDNVHKEVVSSFFLKLMERGYLYEKETDGLYCPSCSKFLPDRYVNGTCPSCGSNDARGDQCDDCGKTIDITELLLPVCKICSGIPVVKKTSHIFFKLSEFDGPLKEWISSQKHWKRLVRNFSDSWFREGLRDRAITRDIDWGVNVPLDGFSDKRIYVWFEAVIGYLSASVKYLSENGRNVEEFWSGDCHHYYFLGKDNIPFHTVIWPSMLMAHGGLNLPYDVPANCYLTLSGLQFSKSRNHAVWMPEYLKRYEPDILRYYLSINMPENRDNDFTWEMFVEKNNGDLSGTIGNFIHRILTFYSKNFGSVRKMDEMPEVTEMIDEAFNKVSEHISSCHFQEAAKAFLHLAVLGNRFLTEKAPWSLIKTSREDCEAVLYNGLRIVWALGFLMHPFMPYSSEKIINMLGEKDIESKKWYDGKILPDGIIFSNIIPVFGRLELDTVLKNEGILKQETDNKKTGGNMQNCNVENVQGGKVENMQNTKKELKDKSSDANSGGYAEITDVMRLGLKTGKILSVNQHPDADKLYVIEVDLGGETRQLVAGLKEYYNPQELLGLMVVVATNLKPAKLRGVVSNGMILAADSGGIVSVLTPHRDVPFGAQVR